MSAYNLKSFIYLKMSENCMFNPNLLDEEIQQKPGSNSVQCWGGWGRFFLTTVSSTYTTTTTVASTLTVNATNLTATAIKHKSHLSGTHFGAGIR